MHLKVSNWKCLNHLAVDKHKESRGQASDILSHLSKVKSIAITNGAYTYARRFYYCTAFVILEVKLISVLYEWSTLKLDFLSNLYFFWHMFHWKILQPSVRKATLVKSRSNLDPIFTCNPFVWLSWGLVAKSFIGICVKKYEFDKKFKIQVRRLLKTEISFIDIMTNL